MEDANNRGQTSHPTTRRLSNIGSAGRNPGNADRDVRRWLRRQRLKDGMALEPYDPPITQKRLRGLGTEIIPHSVILPHELFHFLHKAAGEVWNDGMLGPHGADGIAKFWRHEAEQEWAKEHPAMRRPQDMYRTIPVGLHGDGVRDVKEDKILVLTWNSVLSRAPSWSSRWLFTVLPQRRMAAETLEEVLKVLVWSLRVGLDGYFPVRDHAGNPFPLNSWRWKMAGKPLAGGFRLAFSEQRGDLEFLAMVYGWNCYRHNNICHRCWASSVDDNFAATDFTQTAGWRAATVQHKHYMDNVPPAARSALTLVPGWHLSRVLGDSMHGINLGVAQHLCGNLLWELAQRNCRYRTQYNGYLETFWHSFKGWCKLHRLSCSMGTFTVNGLNMVSAGNYPLLHAKAANTRVLVGYLAEVFTEMAAIYADDEPLQLRALCVKALSDFHSGLEARDRYLTRAEAEGLQALGYRFLLCYSALAREAVESSSTGWHIVPKHHYTCHLLDDMVQFLTNCKYHRRFCDEDYVGRIGRSSRRLHRATVVRGLLLRYIALLHRRWSNKKLVGRARAARRQPFVGGPVRAG